MAVIAKTRQVYNLFQRPVEQVHYFDVVRGYKVLKQSPFGAQTLQTDKHTNHREIKGLFPS